MRKNVKIIRPDDWHVHLRDGAMLEAVVDATAHQFARAIIMPNLATPVTTVKQARDYRTRILRAVDPTLGFTPLMTAYLTDSTEPGELMHGHEQGVFTACKLYPANATTNSSHGVTSMKKLAPALEMMQKIGMPLLVHGEVTDPEIDIFDREAVFIDRVMKKILKNFPELKVVFEHITTKDAAEFVTDAPDNVAATITPHHLEFNRNAIFQGGIRPHYYCLPIAKREIHRVALRKAATSGASKFFLGTDTAPHAIERKESACGCAGIYNAPNALESYAKVFDEENALHKLEAFASLNGPKFYGLPVNTNTVSLTRKPTEVPSTIPAAGSELIPFHAGETLEWTFKPTPKPKS